MILVNDLKKYFPVVSGLRSLVSRSRGKFVKAVDSLNFAIDSGEVLGLVGESGCGKSTTGRVLVGLEEPTAGDVLLGGESSRELRRRDPKAFYRKVQMIFQDPYGSINPQYTVAQVISRPLIYQGNFDKQTIQRKTIETLEQVGLSPAEFYLQKYPHNLSGGQRQRLCIGRAIILDPDFLVADEPISMLDVSIKSGILALLRSLVMERGLSMLYITHDLATVGHVCRRTAIMYLGRIVEQGPTDEILDNPVHPYTKALVAAIPVPDPDRQRLKVGIKGAIPDPINLPQGCRFQARCPEAMDKCLASEPELIDRGAGHSTACHRVVQ